MWKWLSCKKKSVSINTMYINKYCSTQPFLGMLSALPSLYWRWFNNHHNHHHHHQHHLFYRNHHHYRHHHHHRFYHHHFLSLSTQPLISYSSTLNYIYHHHHCHRRRCHPNHTCTTLIITDASEGLLWDKLSLVLYWWVQFRRFNA